MLFQGLRCSYSLPGTQKHYFPWKSWILMKLIEISPNSMKFRGVWWISGLLRFLGCQAPQPLLFPKENKGFVKGCGWLKIRIPIISNRIHGMSEIFMEMQKVPLFSSISQHCGPAALARKNNSNSYAFSMVVALIFLPGHPKIWFFMKNWIRTKIMGDFMKFEEILVKIGF